MVIGRTPVSKLVEADKEMTLKASEDSEDSQTAGTKGHRDCRSDKQ